MRTMRPCVAHRVQSFSTGLAEIADLFDNAIQPIQFDLINVGRMPFK